LPGDNRGSSGNFSRVGGNGHWWSSTENGTDLAYFRYLYHDDDGLFRFNFPKEEGLSVRCLRD
jgi:uncharacterized protein (TIGR02145 family)